MLAGLVFRRNDLKLRDKMTVLFPLYWSLSGPKQEVSYFFPIFFRHKQENYDATVLFPIYWRFDSPDSKTWVIPPYFSVDSPKTKTKAKGIAPFWTLIQSTENPSMSFQILGGLFAFDRDEKGESEVTFLYFLKL